MLSMRKICIAVILLSIVPVFSSAATLIGDSQEYVKARVLDVLTSEVKNIPGTDASTLFQSLQVEILEGSQKGNSVVVQNDYLKLKKGEVFYLTHTVDGQTGAHYYAVRDKYRLPALLLFVALFVVITVIFGGIQGVRGLVSLGGSFLVIGYVLLPGILKGYSPLLLSLFAASIIIILGSYITHGFKKVTTSAVVGMVLTVCIAGALAYIAITVLGLTGFDSEEATYLNFRTQGGIDFRGLLFGGIMIGLLGVLYDVAIGQAVAVEELGHIAPHVSRKSIYTRAIRIGREHIGALVDTLAIAYVGASLPLLLLFYAGDTPWHILINREIFANEIIRIIVGSIGIILAVPVTTAFSVWMLIHPKKTSDPNILESESHALTHHHHHH